MERRTHDVWLVASLIVYGIPYERIDTTNPNQKIFVFKDTPEFQEVYKLYYSGNMAIPSLLTFKETFKHILDLVKHGN